MRALLPAAVCLFFFATAPLHAAFFGFFDDSPESVIAKEGKITVDASAIEPAGSRHYRYKEGKTSVQFFVVRDKNGTVRAAIDACEVCWKAGKGYAREGEAMLCQNCKRKFPLDRIGVIVGGCNPHPFAFALDKDVLTISAEELLKAAKYFPENGQ
jgi:uncharacterized membrane protein